MNAPASQGPEPAAPARNEASGDGPPSTGRCLRALWRRDLLLLARSPAQSLQGLQLFIIGCVLLPLAVSPDPALLREVGNGWIWAMCLLASMLGVSSQLRQDYSDGGIEALLSSPCAPEWLALAKWGAHWSVVCLPLVLCAPAVAWTYGYGTQTILLLALALLLTTPVVCAFSMLSAMLSAGVRGGDLLAATIALPLALPVMVVGADAVGHHHWQREVSAHLYFMSGLLLASLLLMPWAGAAALRLSVDRQ